MPYIIFIQEALIGVCERGNICHVLVIPSGLLGYIQETRLCEYCAILNIYFNFYYITTILKMAYMVSQVVRIIVLIPSYI